MARKRRHWSGTTPREELMRYVMGEEYGVEEEADPGERPVVRHVRTGMTPLVVLLAVIGTVVLSVSLMLSVWPRSAVLVGLVPSPRPLEAWSGSFDGQNYMLPGPGAADGNVRFSFDGITAVAWDGGFTHRLGYRVRNMGQLPAYPTIRVFVLDADGRTVDSIDFSVSDGVVQPLSEESGTLSWVSTPVSAGGEWYAALVVSREASGSVLPESATPTVSVPATGTPATAPAGPKGTGEAIGGSYGEAAGSVGR